MRRLIEHPGALQVLDFADGIAQLVAVKAYYGGPLVGREISFLRAHNACSGYPGSGNIPPGQPDHPERGYRYRSR